MRAKNTGIVDGARLLEEAKKAFEKEGEGAFLELLEWAISQLLIENFAYVYIPYLPQEVEEIFILGSYPAEWQHYYKKNNLHKKDPVISISSSTATPFYWDEKKSGNDHESEIFRLACNFGIEQGFTVPLHEPGCAFGSLHLSSQKNNQEFYDLIDKNSHVIQSLANMAHLHRPSSVKRLTYKGLSQRELECLYWSSLGKTNQEVGIILNITERTVTFHINNCMSKLETFNAKQTITKALRLGLI